MKKQLPWITALAIIFITFGTVYGTVQQPQRYDANYPLVQIVQNVVTKLNLNRIPGNVASDDMADVSSSLVLLGCAGSVAMLTIIYLIATMPTNKRE